MRRSILQLLSKHTFQNLLKSNSTKWLIGLFNVLLLFALLAAYSSSLEQAHTLDHYSQEVRERWESNPDKHPHRMAHYGYVAFRQKYPLSFFDYGMDSYLGNAVFLEAHRQNTINFSEASLSSSLLRFGEISAALILQLLVPLLLFFWGFSLIAKEREQGTLQLLLAQGTSWSELIIGKTLGLFYLSLVLLLPSVVVALGLLFFHPSFTETPDVVLSFGTLAMGYLIYLFIMSLLAVWISATCQTSKTALIQLIGCWLFFTLMLPKLAQVTGQVFYPSPSKIEFDTAVEEELIEQG
ncbi:MAG: ABC transporter permease subunit, partial [Bacteroidota bacterium]